MGAMEERWPGQGHTTHGAEWTQDEGFFIEALGLTHHQRQFSREATKAETAGLLLVWPLLTSEGSFWGFS